jgi:hypothetical protein
MISYVKNFFTKNKEDKKDATWFAMEASTSERQKILEEVVEKSNQDQKELIREYQKEYLRV